MLGPEHIAHRVLGSTMKFDIFGDNGLIGNGGWMF